MYSKATLPTKFRGNIGLPQFVSNCSKTKNAINFIKDQQEDVNEIELFYDMFTDKTIEVNHHRIALIFTNNSLLENTMWKVRANNDLGHLNILTLSSSIHADCHGIKDIQEIFLNITNIKNLPHIIIMCSHSKRIMDIITLITRFETQQIKLHPKLGNILPFFDVIFDEADRNLGIIGKFLKSDIVRKDENNEGGSLLSVMFVTATAFDNFWKMMSDNNINSLDRTWLNERLMAAAYENGYDNFKDYYNFLLTEYRQIDDHDKIFVDDTTMNPIIYAETVFPNLLEYKSKNFKPISVFAPAKNTIKSHLEMTHFFLEKKYAVLLHNGIDKEFRFPNGVSISVDDFSKRYNVVGELRDVLQKFREIYPYIDFAITGYKTVERGVTFNTTGFNFTHAIISSYHANDIASLLQILGRTNGDVRYVGIITIISPKRIIDDTVVAIKRINKILETMPEVLSKDDFNSINDNEYLCKQIPIVCNITADEYKRIVQKNGKRYDRNYIVKFLKERGYSWINDNEYNINTLLQVSEITTNELTEKARKTTKSSYQKHILDGIDKNKRGDRGIIDMKFKGDQETKKCWNIFIDGFNKSNHLLVIYRWDGTQKL